MFIPIADDNADRTIQPYVTYALIALQVVSGLGLLGEASVGGVAYAAHIGGFIAGLLLIKFFDPLKKNKLQWY